MRMVPGVGCFFVCNTGVGCPLVCNTRHILRTAFLYSSTFYPCMCGLKLSQLLLLSPTPTLTRKHSLRGWGPSQHHVFLLLGLEHEVMLSKQLWHDWILKKYNLGYSANWFFFLCLWTSVFHPVQRSLTRTIALWIKLTIKAKQRDCSVVSNARGFSLMEWGCGSVV